MITNLEMPLPGTSSFQRIINNMILEDPELDDPLISLSYKFHLISKKINTKILDHHPIVKKILYDCINGDHSFIFSDRDEVDLTHETSEFYSIIFVLLYICDHIDTIEIQECRLSELFFIILCSILPRFQRLESLKIIFQESNNFVYEALSTNLKYVSRLHILEISLFSKKSSSHSLQKNNRYYINNSSTHEQTPRSLRNGLAQLIISLSYLSNLEVLSLPRNEITDDDGVLLVSNIQRVTNLKIIELSSNSIGDKTCFLLGTKIENLTNLTHLCLSNNLITNEGFIALVGKIDHMVHLVEMNFRFNRINNNIAKELYTIKIKNQIPMKIDLSYNFISTDQLLIMQSKIRNVIFLTSEFPSSSSVCLIF